MTYNITNRWKVYAEVNLQKAAIARKAGNLKLGKMYVHAARQNLQFAKDVKCQNVHESFASNKRAVLPVAWLPGFAKKG